MGIVGQVAGVRQEDPLRPGQRGAQVLKVPPGDDAIPGALDQQDFIADLGQDRPQVEPG